jgi:hypothetical protein
MDSILPEAEHIVNHLAAALAYAARRWPVFPCRPRGKAPMTPHGLKDASLDEATIHRWWHRWPDANMGITTGAAAFVVIDLDPQHNSAVGVELLESKGCYFPETVESITGGGRRHLLYTPPGMPIRNDNKGTLGPGIDVRGDGGYVIVPTSLHASGHRYIWEATSGPDDVPMAPLPEWVVTRLQVRQAAEHPADGPPIPEGQRNATLASLAGVMRRAGMTAPEIEAALRVINTDRRRADWQAILLPHGWVPICRRGDMVYWRRPGKREGLSATTNFAKSGRFHVFTSNAPPFEADTSYAPFSAYALLEHGGAFKAAAQALRQEGYGIQHRHGMRTIDVFPALSSLRTIAAREVLAWRG